MSWSPVRSLELEASLVNVPDSVLRRAPAEVFGAGPRPRHVDGAGLAFSEAVPSLYVIRIASEDDPTVTVFAFYGELDDALDAVSVALHAGTEID